MPSATGLGADEHTSEPRSLIGPLVQVMGHETRGSDWFAVNQQNKALWRPRWRLDKDTDPATASCVCSSVAILIPPLVPEPTGNNRGQIRPIRYPDDQFLLHWPILFGMACAVRLQLVCQHARSPGAR